MQITEQYTCPCRPMFTYKSKQTFQSHKKSKRHQLYEVGQTQRNVRAHEKRIENENEVLKHRIRELESQHSILINTLNRTLCSKCSQLIH